MAPFQPVGGASRLRGSSDGSMWSCQQINAAAVRGAPLDMRILILNWYDMMNPAAGGAERYLHQIFSRLADGGAEVTLFTRLFAGAKTIEEVDGLRVVRVPASIRSLAFGALTMVIQAWHYYRKHRADFDVVIDCVNKVPFFTPLYVDKPRLSLQHHFNDVTFHEELPPGLAHLGEVAEHIYFRLYANEPFVVVSESTREDLVRFGIYPLRCRVIYNGASQPNGYPVTKSPMPKVVYLGRLKRYKRIDLLLRAMAIVAQTQPQAQLVVVGDGPDRRRLKEMAVALGLRGNVKFEGRVSERRREELLGSAWLNATASKKEGWGLSVLEAGILGVPTVATNVSGLRDTVIHGKTGYLVKYGDTRAMAGAITQLIENADLRQGMGQQARLFAERFTWEDSADQMKDFIEDLHTFPIGRALEHAAG